MQSRTMELCGQLKMLKKGGSTIAKYILRAKNILDHLTFVGEKYHKEILLCISLLDFESVFFSYEPN